MIASGFISNTGAVMFDKVVPTILSDLAPVIVALVIVLVLSASMSTLSSLVLTSSSTLTLDAIKPRLEKKKAVDDKKSIFNLRVFIVFFIAISAIIAILKDSIWKGCEACTNHDILVAKNRKFCICTAMLYDPAKHEDDAI